MADVLTNACVDAIAQYILGKANQARSLSLGLFVNNIAFQSGTALANLTECTAPGYARMPLGAANWTGGTILGVATYTQLVQTFGITGQGNPAQTVFGHFVIDTNTNTVLWGQTWATPWVIPANPTQNPSITPQWTDQQC